MEDKKIRTWGQVGGLLMLGIGEGIILLNMGANLLSVSAIILVGAGGLLSIMCNMNLHKRRPGCPDD